MNTNITSKEEILKISKELIQNEGTSSISIRKVAKAADIAVGSVYNYFGSKDDLVNEAIESVWREIFHGTQDEDVFNDIISCVTWMYKRMENGSKKYHEFFNLDSFSYLKSDNNQEQDHMDKTWRHILDGIVQVLKKDNKIRDNAFNAEFTEEKFASIIFTLLLNSSIKKDFDPSALIEIIKRTVY